MTDSNKCVNHPIAPAIGQCRTCSDSLCGMCASFSGSDFYCETCFENHENEQTVQARTAQFEEMESNSLEPETELEDYRANSPSKINWQYIQIGLICFCLIAIAYPLYQYNQPVRDDRPIELIIRERNTLNLVECLTVFAEIGTQLNKGLKPSDELICKDSFLPNRMTDTEGAITVFHPNPKVYGYQEISVSSENPTPNTVALD